jgi:type I site-specific restriction endonuclease
MRKINDRGWRKSKGRKAQKKEKTKHANIDKDSAKLKVEGVHLLGAELVLLLSHGLLLAIILEEPRS